ncbi:MAG: phage tail sheath family protein [Candidatus Binatia bacterium]
MPTLTYPGVYVQEIPSGVRPIEAASTSTAAFVGLAEMGPDDEARRITNWTEFQRYYGTFINDSFLAHSVFQFFNNGGRQCYIVRVTRQSTPPDRTKDAVAANVTVQNRAPTPVDGLTFSAKNKGAWGNYLFLQIEDGSTDPGNEFKISVRRQAEVDIVPENFLDIAPLEVHDNLSMDPNAANYVVNVLGQNSNLIDAQVLATNDALQRGIHRGGFGPAIAPGPPPLTLGDNRSFQVNLDYDGFQLVSLPDSIAASTDLTAVAAAIQTAVRALTKKKTSTLTAAFTSFTCEVEQGARLVLGSGTNTSTPGIILSSVRIQNAASNNAATLLRLGAGNGGRSENALAVRRPAKGDRLELQRGIHRGGTRPTLPLGTNRSFHINVDDDGFQPVSLPDSIAASTDLTAVAAAIQTAVRALTKKKTSTLDATLSAFTCEVVGTGATQQLILQSGTNTEAGTVSPISSVRIQNAEPNNAATALKLGAGNGGRSENGLAVLHPLAIQIGDAARAAPVTAVTPGADGTADAALSFSAAFTLLDSKTDFSLLAVPGENTTVLVDEGMNYCQKRPLQDVFYIGETLATDDTPEEAEAFRAKLTKPNSYGALYFPWIKALDPSGKSSEPILLPPSGYIAGLYARIDASRGVWKAPAGTEASLGGAVGLAIDLTDVQHGNLNPLNLNVIRRFPASGIVAFGARTVTSDPEWKYVPVRRMAIMLRVSIYYGIQWAVFEPNDEGLWSQLRLNITSFMMTLFRQAAFQGATPSQAFFVKCDSETTTQADIDLGIVNMLVGFAPLKPAEFVVVKISQKAGQSSS